MMKSNPFLTILTLLAMTVSCNKSQGHGDLDIRVSHTFNDQPLVTDTCRYHNEAGESMMVTEIQWFISSLSLKDEQGITHPLDKIFYIDTNLPETQTLKATNIPCGKYVSMQFAFGLDESENRTGIFLNPPECNMFWPEPLGGGYHYMKLNAKYVNQEQQLVPVNIHLGIGQNESLTEFYQNYFTVELPIDLTITERKASTLRLDMVIDNWFRNPHTYRFEEWPTHIMQNQQAQQVFKENGHDVFRILPETESRDSLAKVMSDILHKAAPKPHFYTMKNMKETLSELNLRKNQKK